MQAKFFRYVAVMVLIIGSVFPFTHVAHADGIPWFAHTSDTFDRDATVAGDAGTTTGVGNDWTDVHGGVWNINDSGQLVGTTSDENGFTSNFLLRPSTENRLTQREDITFPAGTDFHELVGVVLRYDRTTQDYYLAHVGLNALFIYKVIDGEPTLLHEEDYPTLDTSHQFTLTFFVEGAAASELIGQVHDQTADEYFAFTDFTDNAAELQQAGSTGLVVWSGEGGTSATIDQVVTEQNQQHITSCSGLEAINSNALTLKQDYVLDASIALNTCDPTFVSLGVLDGETNAESTGFAGTLDLNENTLSNFGRDSGMYTYQGLFSYLRNGAMITNGTLDGFLVSIGAHGGTLAGAATGREDIDDITITNSEVDTEDNYAGGLIGEVDGDIYINHLDMTNMVVSGHNDIGGVAGYADAGAEISHANVSAVVVGNQYVGGVVGETDSAELNTIEMEGTVNGLTQVGGLVGRLYESTLEGSDTYAIVHGLDPDFVSVTDVGGAAGHATNATLRDLSVYGDVTIGSSDDPIDAVSDIGGVVGNATEFDYLNGIDKQGTDVTIYAGGTAVKVGGIVGNACDGQNNCEIYQDTASGTVNVHAPSATYVGGIAGYFDDSFDGSYGEIYDVGSESDLNVYADTIQYLGGFSGYIRRADASEIYAHGSITTSPYDLGESGAGTTSYVGGLIGYANQFYVNDSYANSDMSLTIPGIDGLSASAIGGLIGQTASAANFYNTYSHGSIGISVVDGDGSTDGIGGLIGVFHGQEIQDSFAQDSISQEADVIGDTGSLIGSYDGDAGDYVEIDNDYYDAFERDTTYCIGSDLGLGASFSHEDGSCTAKNTVAEGNATYFSSNNHETNQPESAWTFSSSVWAPVPDDLPILSYFIVGPEVTDEGVTPSNTSADFSVAVADNDFSSVTVGVNFGTTIEYDQNEHHSISGAGYYFLTIGSLVCNTEYHYQLYAIDAGDKETDLGDATFTTSACSTHHSGGGYVAPNLPGLSSDSSGGGSSGGSSSGSSSGSGLSSSASSSSSDKTPSNVTSDATSSHDAFSGHELAEDSGLTGPSPFDGSTEPISNVAPGWYIRGTNYDTVYYVTQDGKRRPFWDIKTFFTYANSWNDVIWVSDATLPTLPMDQPMLPKSGVILVKVQSNATTYAVSPSNVLQAIPDEATATSLFGSAWADDVIDVDPTIMKWFTIGSLLTTKDSVDKTILKTRTQLAS